MKLVLGKKIALGFTLIELMTSVGCGSFILAAVVAAGVSLQKSYTAFEGYSNAESDQLRVLDYIAMDCRRATNASITTATVNNGAENITVNQLVLTVPAYYSAVDSTATANTPVLGSGGVTYGGGSTVTVKYYINYYNSIATASGNVAYFVREVVTATTDNITPIAKNVASFAVTDLNPASTGTVTCWIMFFPTFARMPGTGAWWSGQYSPDHSPDNSIGVNGDWYVVNYTATDQTTVGDVYCKSGGAYSKINNVKATTVYCNTFLREADARQTNTN
jgi:hypothetical protein